jgi:hypothetical protein
MPLSWNDIKARAASFVNEWKDSAVVGEKQEAQTYIAGILNIYGGEGLKKGNVKFGQSQICNRKNSN